MTPRRKRPKPAGRVRLGVDERRAQLLELGLAIFGSTNYDAVAIDDIAARAGMSKGLLYHYFSSKRGFYVAVIRHAAAKLAEQFVFDAGLPPEGRARRGLEIYLDFVSDRAQAYIALMRSGVGADPEVLEIVDSVRNVAVEIILGAIGAKGDPAILRLAFRSWIGFVEASALAWLARPDVDRGVVVELAWRMLVQTGTEALKLETSAKVDTSVVLNLARK